MNEKELKLTDLDYATGSHHLQMMKAALPYMEIPQQRFMSMYIKWNELMRTMEFFQDNEEGMLSVCSLDEKSTSPADMLQAIKPFANQREQEMIDFMSKMVQNPMGRGGGKSPFPMEQLISILPPEQQSRFETIQLMMQTMGQM